MIKPEILTYIHDKPIYRQNIGLLPSNKALTERSRALRKAGVLSEVVFWRQVRNDCFWSIDFDRQRIIGSYIVDFYVKSLGLIIEIDGSSHNDKEEYDNVREYFFVNLGLNIFRISDSRVKNDLENVMKELENYIIKQFG